MISKASKSFTISHIIHGTIDGTHYLLGDKGYPLLTQWLMMQHRKGKHKILESLYNKRHKRGKSTIKSEFGVFEKLVMNCNGKIEIHIDIIYHHLITCCSILHNLFFGHHKFDVGYILCLLQEEHATQNKYATQRQHLPHDAIS